MLNILLEFDQINLGPHNKTPTIDIKLNNQSLYNGPVVPKIICKGEYMESNHLEIYFTNKEDKDTIVNNLGYIINDMSFNLTKIVINDHNLEELIWQGKYMSDIKTYPACLYFGPRGKFVLNFNFPILKWILKTRNEITQNDFGWEEDYNYYINACRILNNI